MNSIHRLTVEVADYQEFRLTGPPISVAATRDGRSDRVDLWFENVDGHGGTVWALWIFGTGHPVPWTHSTRFRWSFLGTVVTPSGLVWHCYTGPLRSEVSS